MTKTMPPGLKLAWYGDDFTGASDTLATLAEAGLKARLFLDVPTAVQLRDAGALDAIGIAGSARAMAPDAMRAALAPVARFFADCGAPVLHYKCCSTFDSAPEVGSIGAAVRQLQAALGGAPALIVGGQPSLGRYCAFGQLFATAGAGGPAHRIDRHPTMSRHPVTPMHEADLRLHLGRQGLTDVALCDLSALDGEEATVDGWIDTLEAPCKGSAPDAVLIDVVNASQLARIGGLVWQRARVAPRLCVGASSVAQALLAHWGMPIGRPGAIATARGPVFVLAGSLSPQTARQIAATRSYRLVALDPVQLARGDPDYLQETVCLLSAGLRAGEHMLASTTLGATDRRGEANVMQAIARHSARLLRGVVETSGITRLGVAGGDTSSHALLALAPQALDWLGRPSPGVALCRIVSDAPWLAGLEVMLKGGQMGDEGLFETLVRGTG